MTTSEVLKKIAAHLSTQPHPFVVKTLNEFKRKFIEFDEETENTEFTIAFVGTVGVGKTSAICKLTGLTDRNEDGEILELLQTGSGRTTICEVEVRNAEHWQITVTPVPEDEVLRICGQLASYGWDKCRHGEREESDGAGPLLSKEVLSCIRSMTGTQDNYGKDRIDKLVELANTFSQSEDFEIELRNRLNLGQRTETVLEYPVNGPESWNEWLRKTFAAVNKGREPSVSMPQKILVEGPLPASHAVQDWIIVDTRGMDGSADREDLRLHVQSELAFPVVCSSFKQAPDDGSLNFLKSVLALDREKRLAQDITLLILDHNESPKVSDIDPEITGRAERRSMGRRIKQSEAESRLKSEIKRVPPIEFFDSHLDDPDAFWHVMSERRDKYKIKRQLLHENWVKVVEEIINDNGKNLQYLIDETRKLRKECKADLRGKLNIANYRKRIADDCGLAHPRSLAASASRFGSWHSFDVYEKIYRETLQSLTKDLLLVGEQLNRAYNEIGKKYPIYQNYVPTLRDVHERELSKFAENTSLTVKGFWKDHLGVPSKLWDSAQSEWGTGKGYRDRVAKHWISYCDSPEFRELLDSTKAKIEDSWNSLNEDPQG